MSGATAHRVNDTHRNGGRVIAIGTTVVRALETVVDERGRLHAGSGWTETVVTPDRVVRSVDGLLDGLARARGLASCDAAGDRRPDLLESSYAAALDERLPLARVRRRSPRASLSVRRVRVDAVQDAALHPRRPASIPPSRHRRRFARSTSVRGPSLCPSRRTSSISSAGRGLDQ